MTRNLKKTAGPATKGLRVVARPAAGFCRASRHWPAEATTVPLSELSPDEVEAIKGEAQLVATEVDIEPEKA